MKLPSSAPIMEQTAGETPEIMDSSASRKSNCNSCGGKKKKPMKSGCGSKKMVMSSNCDSCGKKKARLCTSEGNFCSSFCSSKRRVNPCCPRADEEEEEESREKTSLSSYKIFGQTPKRGTDFTDIIFLYRRGGPKRDGVFRTKTSFNGFVKMDGRVVRTNEVEIHYTVQGDKGPIVMLFPGVPVNHYEFSQFQNYLSPFCRTVAVSYIGTGGSSNVLQRESYLFKDDVEYMLDLKEHLFPDEPFHVFGNDWGGAIALHAASASTAVESFAVADPTYSTNFPVLTIQHYTKGLHALIDPADMSEFARAAADLPAKVEETIKSMLENRSKINQASVRELTFHLADQDYERPGASTANLDMDVWAAAAMVERAYALAPDQTRPMSSRNPEGLDTAPLKNKKAFIAYGRQDDMMSPLGAGTMPYEYELRNAVIHLEEGARHLIVLDKPREIAEAYLYFLLWSVHVRLADVFIGFPRVMKRNEEDVLRLLRAQNDYSISSEELYTL